MKYFYLSLLASALLLCGFAFLYGISGTTVIVGSENIRGIREAFLTSQTTRAASSLFQALPDLPRPSSPPASASSSRRLRFSLRAGRLPRDHERQCRRARGHSQAGRRCRTFAAGAARHSRNRSRRKSLRLATAARLGGADDDHRQRLRPLAKDIRRLLAYSSIAHGGYLLIGLAVAAASMSSESHQAAGGAGGMRCSVSWSTPWPRWEPSARWPTSARPGGNSPESKRQPASPAISLWQRRYWQSFMFSLTGIPRWPGFGASSRSLAAAHPAPQPIKRRTLTCLWFVGLAIVAALNAAIGAAYYLRIIGVMYFQSPGKPAPAAGGRLALVGGVLCALLVIGSGMFPAQIVGLSLRAEQKLVEQAPAPQKANIESALGVSPKGMNEGAGAGFKRKDAEMAREGGREGERAGHRVANGLPDPEIPKL